MTRMVLFNGSVLIRAGGASKVDASAFQSLGVSGVGVVGVIGEAAAGEPNAVHYFRSPEKMIETFKSGPLADAANLLFNPMNDPRVPGGAAQVLAVKVNQSVQGTLDLSKGADKIIKLLSKDWGVHANKISVEVSTSGGGKVVEFKYDDGKQESIETSPVLGGTAEFTLVYTGAGSAATATFSKTGLTTTVTGATGQNLDLKFLNYPTLNELIKAINIAAGGVYTAVAVTTNPYGFQCVNLDWLTAINIKTTAANINAKVWRMVEWINANSSLVSATRYEGAGEGEEAPDDVGPITLASGARGISSNSNWQDGLDLLAKVRVNQVVPLISYDLTSDPYGSTATLASVVSAVDAHASYCSSTKGKSERQAFIGMAGTKSALIAQAGVLQSPHSLVTGQKATRNNAAGELVQFPEWGLAAIAAGARAGSLLGEPLVYKNIRCSGLTQDSSWNPEDDSEDLILAGVTVAFAPPNRGFKFDRVITTYTKLDNDAYTEESIVQGWKNVSYGLRTQMEDIFTGTKGMPATIQQIKNAMERILEAYRKEGQIVDSVDEAGNTTLAYRDLQVNLDGDKCYYSATISPVAGVNFLLQSLFLVPAGIAA